MNDRTFILRDATIMARFVAFLAQLDLSKPWEVVLRPFVDRRTKEQNARLWKLHTIAGDFVGCSPEDMHEDMLCMFHGYTEVRMPSGDVKRIPLKRSSTRNKKEFGEFMEKVEAFYASQLGVFLP